MHHAISYMQQVTHDICPVTEQTLILIRAKYVTYIM